MFDFPIIELIPNQPDPTFLPPEFSPRELPVAVSGDLSIERLLAAYRQGIYPHFNRDDQIMWWCPDPRTVLYLEDFHVSRSLRKSIRNRNYTATLDNDFEAVIHSCATVLRKYPSGLTADTWITPGMMNAYLELFRKGYAHSIEIWHSQKLVGGLYGVSLGLMFFGESMFHTMRDASKVALYYLVEHLKRWNFTMIDCQLPNELLFSLGAQDIPRLEFLAHVRKSVEFPQPNNLWKFV